MRSLRPSFVPSFAPVAALVGGILAVAACSSPANLSGFDNGDKKTNGTDPTNGSFSDPSNTNNTTNPDGTPKAACVPDKANAEIAGDGCDNDGDGQIDNVAVCDTAIANDGSGADFAKTMGICDDATTKGFGLVAATFTRGYARTDAPMPQQHGILPKFGDVLKPREGSQLGVLSSGYAQEYDGSPGTKFGGDADGVDWFHARPGQGNGTAPPGFPKPADGCPGDSNVNDVSNLHLQLKAPPNAIGIKFDFNFHSGEWPAFICSEFNDGFVAFLDAKGFNGGVADNISFDSMKNPVSVNNGFFDRCTAGVPTGCAPGSRPATSTCPAGPGELAGTGFGIVGNYCMTSDQMVAGGATGWLTSQAAVTGGETFTLDLMIWDTGDGNLDSSVLLDNFKWVGGNTPVVTSTGRPTGPN
jgi:hypothetical protein